MAERFEYLSPFKEFTDMHFVKDFELLAVSEILSVSQERFEEVKKFAFQIKEYNIRLREDVQKYYQYKHDFTIKDGYHLTVRFLRRIKDNTLFIGPKMGRMEFQNSGEKALFAMLLCDDKCDYYNAYINKKEEGLSGSEAMDYLDYYYGIKSAKLIQIEGYYKALLSRYARIKKENTNTGIFDEIEDEDIKPVR